MTVDPVADRRAAERHAENIRTRRTRVRDDAEALLRDDLLATAWHPARHTGVAVEVLREDFTDACALAAFLERDLDRLWLALIALGQRAGLSYRQMAPVMGKPSRQAVETQRRRLESAVGGGSKDERPSRAGRRHGRALGRMSRSAGVRELLRDLGPHLGRMAELGVDVDGLDEVPARGPVPAGTVAVLRLAVRELRGCCLDDELGALAVRGAQLLDL